VLERQVHSPVLAHSLAPQRTSDDLHVPQHHVGSTLDAEARKGATFEEFLRDVNFLEADESEERNQHWETHYRLCHPCSIAYDYVVKAETMQKDSPSTLRRLGLNDTEFPLVNVRRTEGKDPLEKTLEEYRSVPVEELRKIQALYQADMDLFGYKGEERTLKARCGAVGAPCNQNGCC
jgi:chondroitin 4-sulfotransferase 11/chondroitin 4-sulfotransferase 13